VNPSRSRLESGGQGQGTISFPLAVNGRARMDPVQVVHLLINCLNSSFAFISSEKAIRRCMISGVIESALKGRTKTCEVVWRATAR